MLVVVVGIFLHLRLLHRIVVVALVGHARRDQPLLEQQPLLVRAGRDRRREQLTARLGDRREGRAALCGASARRAGWSRE